jgi:CRISPR/Cas system-associated protein Csm6
VRAGARDARGLGLHDLVEAIAESRPPRASAELAAHVVDVATSILASSERGSVVAIESETSRPEALALDQAVELEQAAEL